MGAIKYQFNYDESENMLTRFHFQLIFDSFPKFSYFAHATEPLTP